MGKAAKQQGNMTKAVAYLRVSTDDQNLGPQAQFVAIQRFASSKGIEIVAVHEDHGVSGGAQLDRCPQLLAAIDSLKNAGAGLLLVSKRDRLARDVVKAAMIEQLVSRAGGVVTSAAGEGEGSDPAAQLMRTMVDAFAAYERALIGQRTKAALSIKKGKGERVGGIPWGYDAKDDGQLVQNNEELALIERCRTMKANGMKLREIAHQLNEEGVQLRGKPLYEVKVHRLLKAA